MKNHNNLQGINFLDRAKKTPSLDEITQIKNQCDLSVNEIAEIALVKPRTIYGWLMPVDSIAHRTPSMATWRQLMYELFARQQGYDNLEELLKNLEKQKNL